MPHDPYKPGAKMLLRCDCGALYWAKPDGNVESRILVRHAGHRHRIATEGSWWEMLKLKLGWIDG